MYCYTNAFIQLTQNFQLTLGYLSTTDTGNFISVPQFELFIFCCYIGSQVSAQIFGITTPYTTQTLKYYSNNGINEYAFVTTTYHSNLNSIYLGYDKYRYNNNGIEANAPVNVAYIYIYT